MINTDLETVVYGVIMPPWAFRLPSPRLALFIGADEGLLVPSTWQGAAPSPLCALFGEEGLVGDPLSFGEHSWEYLLFDVTESELLLPEAWCPAAAFLGDRTREAGADCGLCRCISAPLSRRPFSPQCGTKFVLRKCKPLPVLTDLPPTKQNFLSSDGLETLS